ncbi:polyprenyl synthetase family protein [Spongisporangium articulatum]|uniref:Polyprenyl synthetase family protein n=1 Tax=Spongisporangium articulatum TaxID=3362603 RepID=A0ABW8ANS6_9ACTN
MTSPVAAVLDLPVADAELARSVQTGLEAVEVRLREAVRHQDQLADDASRHLVEAGGKRVRPMLALIAAQLGDPTRPEIVDAAVVCELTHLASLYHDDVMDSAPLRRGVPAAHEVYGNTVAILTGDLLFARASRVVANLGPDAVQIQARTFERLCIGQFHETVGPAPGEDPVEHYIQVLADKTGSLIAASARLGAMFAGCPPHVIDVLVTYGEKVGVAFQLADDVIDLTSTDSGKTSGTDLREGVPTMPGLLVRRAAEAGDAQAAAVVELLDGDLSTDEALAAAVAALRAHPAMEQARQEALRWAREAVEALDDLPSGKATEALRAFAGLVVDRTR